MTSRSRTKFPVRVSETKRVKITLPCFKSLTAVDLCPKDDFDQLFNFQGPVISECTTVQKLPVMKTSSLRNIEIVNIQNLFAHENFQDTVNPEYFIFVWWGPPTF